MAASVVRAGASVGGVQTVTASDPSTSPTPTITPDTTVDPSTGDGDHDKFAHICRKEDVTRAYITGEAIEADCYNLPGESGLAGTNPTYAAQLSRLAAALGLDTAYVEEIAGFTDDS